MSQVDVHVESDSPIAALGIDAGSTTCKAVAVDADEQIVAWTLADMSPRVEDQTRDTLAAFREQAGMTADVPVFATGYGRKLVPDADRAITEITCHARGVFADTGTAGTLVDIGGQDSKVIRIGPNGSPVDFAMNDKCAAGTGRFLEHTAGRLGVALDDLGPTALGAPSAVKITSTCTVFAESEIISLVAHGEPVDRILLGLHAGLVSRILAMVRTVGLVPPLLLSGGVARNSAIVALLAEQSGQEVQMPSRPQLMGAYGAAILACELAVADPADGPVPQVSTGECDVCDDGPD
ncbi:MAG TPA: acyl-CoA dehydratase activase, partial [Actinomycetota bacterium]|nr:acyl-CoA dehydratase activase [Actinomycetota bacterium]